MNLQSTTVSACCTVESSLKPKKSFLFIKYTNNKGFCEDLTEGKFSFPIIHAIRRDVSNRQLLNIISQKPTNVEVKKYALDIIQRTGTFEYVQEYLRRKEEEILAEINRLGGNPLLEKYIETIRIKQE